MNLKEFLREILPTQGSYFSFQINKAGGTRQFPHSDLNQIAASVKSMSRLQHNAYVAIGSFEEKKQRTQEFCKFKRAWYVDIDCKEGGQYATKEEAIAAIKKAMENGLPPYSVLIDSGNGYHPYWICTDDVHRKDWKAEAKALAKACEATGLNVDTAVTEDEARIMRAPDTLNYKDPKQPKPCSIKHDTGKRYSYEEFVGKMNQWRGPTLVSSSALEKVGALIDADDLYAGYDFKDAKAINMVKLCPVFQHSMKTQGEHDGEQLWNQILHTLAYCVDGEQFIHPISDKHPGYSQGKTDRKFQWKLKSKGNSGPTTCKRFSAESNKCATCEYNGKIKSPIKLAFGVPNPLPYPFRNGTNTDRNGNTYDNIEIHNDGSWDEVVPWRIADFQVIDGVKDSPTCISMKCDGSHIVTELKQLIRRDDDLTVTLADKGVTIPYDSSRRLLRNLVNIWVDQLRRTKQTNPGMNKLGWIGKKFHYGRMLHSKDGVEPTRMFDEEVQDIYSPTGDLAPWQACANHILSQPRQASWAILASAFAAPLLKFTGVSGALLSIVSQDTGTGKSTAMKIAAGVWGDPKTTMASLDDTPNSVAHRLGILNTLPSYWDEVREKEQVQRFVTNVFRLSQGKEKSRLTSGIQQRKTGEWDTMLVVASNDPLKDHILHTVGNSDAGVARVFELRAEAIPTDGMSDSDARHFYGQIVDNYGHAGEEYAKWLGTNPSKAEAIVKQLDSALSKKMNTQQDERFWVATIASLLAGAQIATSLGICQFDMPAFKRYLVGTLLSMRTIKKDEYRTPLSRSIELVSRYMHEKKEFIIRAKKMPKRAGNEILLDSDRHPAVIRIGMEDKIVRLLLEDFEKWYYKELGSGQSHIISNLVRAGAVRSRGAIDTGTAGGIGGRFRCLDIPFSTKTFKSLDPG